MSENPAGAAPDAGEPQGYQQPYGQHPYAQQYGPAQKSKLAAGLLGIFLGYLGIHNFYLGNIQRACIQLGLTVVVGWFFGLGVLAAGIWGLVEGIMILTGSPNYRTDAKGIPLKD